MPATPEDVEELRAQLEDHDELVIMDITTGDDVELNVSNVLYDGDRIVVMVNR